MLTADNVRNVFDYDANTGVIKWRHKANNMCRKNLVAGTILKIGYLSITYKYKNYYGHHIAWLYEKGVSPSGVIDHINKVKLDNRIANLRDVTQSENAINSKTSSRNKSGVVGVTFIRTINKWESKIHHHGKKEYLGSFVDFTEAVKARRKAEILRGWDQYAETSAKKYLDSIAA